MREIQIQKQSERRCIFALHRPDHHSTRLHAGVGGGAEIPEKRDQRVSVGAGQREARHHRIEPVAARIYAGRDGTDDRSVVVTRPGAPVGRRRAGGGERRPADVWRDDPTLGPSTPVCAVAGRARHRSGGDRNVALADDGARGGIAGRTCHKQCAAPVLRRGLAVCGGAGQQDERCTQRPHWPYGHLANRIPHMKSADA
jgi:hypothetical protein